MKIVHTSDWHVGRALRRLDRIGEMGDILENLADWLESERVDLCLVSGDVFDSAAPPAEAERVVFGFFKRIGRAGIPCVVIAGNHDNPTRVEAWGGLAELVGVRAVGRPRSHDKGGLLRIETPRGGTALVGVVPFAHPSQFTSALELAGDADRLRERYARGLELMIQNVSSPFASTSVNLLMLHTHIRGVNFAGSERVVHLGDEWAASPTLLPQAAHYVALGHIHRPQSVSGFPCPAEYAGSSMQLDFGEAGEEKSFVVIEAIPGHPAQLTRVPYRGGRSLARYRGTFEEIERDARQLREVGWLAVKVAVPSANPDVNAAVRRLLPNAIKVEVELAASLGSAAVSVPRVGRRPEELFAEYLIARDGSPPADALIAEFVRLHAVAEND